eukprot:TRINITY_DN21989_c0_g1_i1.p2 TRINITY_DN21989_c0_g1~~TRINITY_DN21989_c0_g1_i1.p2  ORF type:complete len:242 (+),score=70.38 TRINITY_DN21989_c0_g1_i1:31-756(+)
MLASTVPAVAAAAAATSDSLKQHAAKAVAAARSVAALSSSPAAGGYPGGNAGDAAATDGLKNLLEDFGCLLGPDGAPVAQGGAGRADIEADVARVCAAALAARRRGLGAKQLGALLPVHDVFCLVNRARGTALVSPEEVMCALRRCAEPPAGSLRLRKLGASGGLAVSLARAPEDDESDDRQLRDLAEVEPLSSQRLAEQAGLTTAEAGYLLQEAEQRGILVRDEAPEGIYFYGNFFDDFV